MNNEAEEDQALRGIVHRDGVGSWKEKAEELNAAMANHYQAMAIAAAAGGEDAVEYGRVAAQCLHRYSRYA